MASERKFEIFFGPDYTAVIRPASTTPTPAPTTAKESVEKESKGEPARKPRPPRTLEQSLKVLEPYKPSENEIELVRWARENLEPVTAAEVHGVIYRSVVGFYIASPKDEILIRAKARELGVGLPGQK